MILCRKLKNTRGQLADIMMFMFFVAFVIYFIVSYTSMHTFFKTQEIVDSIVRKEVEIIRTKGILKTEEYERFLGEINKYGMFEVMITLEKQNEYNQYEKWFTLDEILNEPLKVGDIIKIYAESRKPSLFAEIMSRGFLFSRGGSGKSHFKMQSIASGMICSDGYIRGVEAINIINRYSGKPGITEIKVKTLYYPDPADPSNYTEHWKNDYATVQYDPETALPENVINLAERFRLTMNRDGNHNITEIIIEQLNVNGLT